MQGFWYFEKTEKSDSLVFDFGFFAGKVAEIINSGTSDFSDLIYFDLFDVRGLYGKDSFHTDVPRHFPDGKSFFLACTFHLNDDSPEYLDTFFVSFDNLVMHTDGVSCAE